MREDHNKAAEHHESAAKSHRAAADAHGKNDHAKGKEYSTQAPAAFAECAHSFANRAREEPAAEVTLLREPAHVGFPPIKISFKTRRHDPHNHRSRLVFRGWLVLKSALWVSCVFHPISLCGDPRKGSSWRRATAPSSINCSRFALICRRSRKTSA